MKGKGGKRNFYEAIGSKAVKEWFDLLLMTLTRLSTAA